MKYLIILLLFISSFATAQTFQVVGGGTLKIEKNHIVINGTKYSVKFTQEINKRGTIYYVYSGVNYAITYFPNKRLEVATDGKREVYHIQ